MVKLFRDHCETELFTLKFHLVDHLADDSWQYRSLSFVDAAPFRYFNLEVKQSYIVISKRTSTRMDETVRVMDSVLKRMKSSIPESVSEPLSTTTSNCMNNLHHIGY